MKDPILVKNVTRNIENKVPVINTSEIIDDSNDKTSANQIPPMISPITTPTKSEPDSEVLHLTFCAKNRAATSGDKFPESTYLGPHPRNRNHFVFSIHFQNDAAHKMKTWELPPEYGIVKIRSIAENQNYFHDNQKHCKNCKDWHVKK